MSTPTILTQTKYLENAATDQYTAPTNCKGVRVDDFTVANRTGGAVTLVVRVVPSGATAGAEHELQPSVSIPAGEVHSMLPFWLGPGDKIETTAGAATSLVGRIGGRVFT